MFINFLLTLHEPKMNNVEQPLLKLLKQLNIKMPMKYLYLEIIGIQLSLNSRLDEGIL